MIEEIGPKNFGAIVSDGAASIQLAKTYVAQKYPHIIPIRCIAHHIQLIATDIIKKTSFGSQVLSKCQEFVTYFQNSHMSGAKLRDEIINLVIKGGGLKSSVKTRWCSAWDCCDSILKLEPVLRNVSVLLLFLLTLFFNDYFFYIFYITFIFIYFFFYIIFF